MRISFRKIADVKNILKQQKELRELLDRPVAPKFSYNGLNNEIYFEGIYFEVTPPEEIANKIVQYFVGILRDKYGFTGSFVNHPEAVTKKMPDESTELDASKFLVGIGREEMSEMEPNRINNNATDGFTVDMKGKFKVK